jgi:hypothetical protein
MVSFPNFPELATEPEGTCESKKKKAIGDGNN